MTAPTPPPEATFSDRTTPAGEPYTPPEFTPEPVPPIEMPTAETHPLGTAAPESGTALYVRNLDGSFTQAGSVSDDSPAEMPNWNHYLHTASGKVFQVFDPPAGPRHLDEETGESHQIIGVYPR